MLEPIQDRDLVDQVYQRLRRAIREGALRPGERLVERQLGERLGVSRAPVRDALLRLEQDGLVVPAGRRGKIVATLSGQDAWEVYTLRATLEAMAFGLAASRATPEAVAEMEEIVEEMRTRGAEGDADAIARLDMRFHEAACRASGHGRLLWAWTAMSRQIQLLLHVDTQVAAAARYHDIGGQASRHEALLAAIKAGDAAQAGALAGSHIDTVAQRVIDALASFQLEGPAPSSVPADSGERLAVG